MVVGALLEGFLAVVGLGVVLLLAMHGLAHLRGPVQPEADVIERIHTTAAAAEAAMYDAADRRH
jgi:hypothetical protein